MRDKLIIMMVVAIIFNTVINLIQDIKRKIYVGTKDDTIATVATMRHYECTHDDAVPRPCGLATPYNYIDLKKKEKEVFKTKAGESVSADALTVTI